jgi:hypothetical protein
MKTKTFSNFGIIFAVALTMVTTAVFTACNSEDDFGGDFNGDITGEYSLATRMMTRAGENNNISRPDTINRIKIGTFQNETITCYGRIAGILYSGTVTVSGSAYKDTVSNSYSGYISSIECSVQTPGGARASISEISSTGGTITASFEGSEGMSAGVTFMGNKYIRFNKP